MITGLLPEFEKKEEEKVTKKYIENSTRATGLKDVRKYLKNYLNKNNCTNKVKNFIEFYLDNIALLKKTDIVSDGSYRNCVILVKPYEFYVTHSGGFYEITNDKHTKEDLLQYFLDNATKIFLNMSWATKEDDDMWNDLWFDDYYDDEEYYNN